MAFVRISLRVLDRITRCLSDKGYIRNLKKNLRALEREMEDLRAIKDEVQNKVAREETRHQQRLKAVQVWLDRVDSIDIKCKDLLSIGPVERQKLCLCGLCLCSKNVFSSYKYGKRVFLLLEEVRTLKSEGKFDEVAQPPPRSEFEERPTQHTIGHEEMLAKTWNRLMEDGVGIMGLHGMGGVGKTTLFKKIHNKFDEIPGTFDVVIWIVVSQGATTSKLQEDIAAKLLLCGDEWTNTNEDDKAAKINTFLKRKKFVLMLDDIWEEVDLVEAIGIPFPTRENGCKVAFTTRSQEVCRKMGDHEAMEIKCLKRDEAWELFKTKVGDNTLSRDPGIVKLARWVADKCGGLPLAINVIGKAMASKNIVQEWEHAIDVLTRSAAEFSEMKNKILPVLKFSYDSLGDQQLQSCFLYCALFPEDHQIPKEELLRLWMCEGFLGEYQVIKEVYNKGYAMLGTLIRANLITEVGTEFVVMHDVVREMALWIASDFGKQKETFVVRARVGLLKIPEVKDWGAVRRMSLMNNNIEEITCSSNCCELTTLFLQGNRLKNISGEFLQSMKKLVVLDLSNNIYLSELPEQISELASLQYLDLSFTSIEKLPAGFQELKKLTYIGLFSTKKLCSISGISKLLSLRLLNLVNSNVHGDVSLLKELQLLKNLQGLRITVSAELSLEHILGNQRLANCITSMDIIDFQEKPLQSIENLRSLTVESSHVSEINNLTIPCFTNLSELYITECHSMKDLTWLLFTPNLVFLVITHSREVEEIINKEKATNFKGIIPFQKLEKLIVGDLPKLESICWSPLPFPFLRWILVRDCPKLRKLPLNATSVPLLDEHGSGIHMLPPKQINDLEWEDDDTKNRFLASINRIQYYSGLGTL